MSQISAADPDAAAFVTAFDRSVGQRLTTPRAAKRYGNALLFALPMMGSEVHPVDLMLLEAMRVCYPPLYEWVRSHEQEVLGSNTGSGSRDDSALAAVRAAVDASTAGLAVEDAVRARLLLTTLLPRTESAWENKRWDSSWNDEWAREKRLASELYFRRYFTYTVPPGDVPDADLNKLLAAVGDPAADTNLVASLATEVLDADGADSVLPKLAARVPTLRSDAAAHLAIVVASVSDGFSDASGVLGLSTLDRAAVLVRDLLGQVRLEERGELAAALMRDAQHLPFVIEVIRWLRPQDDHLDRAVLTREECDAAGRVLAERLLGVWCSGEPFTQLSGGISASLHVCALYGDGDALRDCLRRRIDDDLASAFALMRSFLGRAWSLETGVPFVPNLRREGYDALREYVDPGWLFPKLRRQFGDGIGEEDVHLRQTRDEDERLADAYARFYLADTSRAIGDADGKRD